MIISLANLIVDHDPMTVAQRTQDTMCKFKPIGKNPKQSLSTLQSSTSSSVMITTEI